MSLTIDATVGGTGSNSFATESEVISYMAARLNASAWTTFSGSTCTEDEKAALVEATRELSSRAWAGRRVTDTQALSWPRTWAVNPDSPWHWFYDQTVIPQRIKDATCELAFQFLKAGTTDLASLDPQAGVIEKTVDVLTTRWQPFTRPQGLGRYPSVMRFIAPLLEGVANSATVVRG